ncbi:hypothetical protein NLU13_0930 [Sarocladium strictum]|uniref:Uncharacterized protein n=1 Tax=Sarocladium strictum TaxID=5046 RepID=A0AA39LBW1_SARSR|nr:hypothetical protein NLU13_0930 [Sarocladium strictum]
MRFSQSRSSFAILGAAGWLSSGLVSGAEGRPSSATPPPPYPETRTLVKLHPARVNPLLQDADYELWEIGGGSDPAGMFRANSGLNFTIRATDEHDGLVGGAFAPVYTRPLPDVGQRLVGSGITTESDGGSITLTISGLPVGEHWLSTWHNAWKDMDDSDIPSVTLIIDGDSGISGRPQTSQEDNRYGDALIHSWTTFTVDGGDETEVVYSPRGGNVYLNGFEIDSESMGRQIRFPKPAHRDEQVAAPSGVVSASWKRTLNVDGDEFDVYIGTSPDDMRLVGSRVHEPEFNLTGLAAGRTYYWRVDVYDTWWNEALSGRTLTFTTV